MTTTAIARWRCTRQRYPTHGVGPVELDATSTQQMRHVLDCLRAIAIAERRASR